MEETSVNNSGSFQQMDDLVKPIVDDGVVEELLDKIYGLHATQITQLDGFMDCNYAILVKNDTDNPHIKQLAPHGYLMKIINTKDSKQPQMHQAIHEQMDYLRANGIPTQEPVPDKNGRKFSLQKIFLSKSNYKEHIVRVMTFLPGKTLFSYPISTQLLYEDGVFIAKIHMALKNFHHDFFHSFDCEWSLGNIPMLKDYIFVLKQDQCDLVNDVVHAFETEVKPLIPYLPKGHIHGDLNHLNLLIEPMCGGENLPVDKRQYRFTGVIDFQHSAYSCSIYDLAINVAYLMIFTELIGQLDVPGHILAGYSKLRQLTNDEYKALKILLAGRMCQSLVYGAYTHYLDPSNLYVLHTAKKGWGILSRLWSEPQDKLLNRWQGIIESYPNHDNSDNILI